MTKPTIITTRKTERVTFKDTKINQNETQKMYATNPEKAREKNQKEKKIINKYIEKKNEG